MWTNGERQCPPIEIPLLAAKVDNLFNKLHLALSTPFKMYSCLVKKPASDGDSLPSYLEVGS